MSDESKRIKYRLDRGPHTIVGICECGFRSGVAIDLVQALEQGRYHEMRAHVGSESVLKRLDNARRRARRGGRC